MEPGIYELDFHAGDYFRAAGVELTDPPFLDQIVVRFGIVRAIIMCRCCFPVRLQHVPGLVMISRKVIARCRELALHSEEPGFTTRTFLSAPMRDVHAALREWMEQHRHDVRVDAAGNLRGVYESAPPRAPLFIGSHLDTVPRAGAFDGILGVVLGIALVESLGGRRLPFGIEVVGFSEEEGVRFGVPFIGSRALIGDLDEPCSRSSVKRSRLRSRPR